MRITLGRVAVATLFLLTHAGLASAADVKVFSTIGVQAALEELAPQFEKASGHKLQITWATAGSDAVFASSGMAMVVKKGAPKPDISTPEAFKQALLKAKTISYSNPEHGGASGVYLAKLIERMGIADQLKAKTVYPPPSGNAGKLAASGEAELAIQQEPEVMSAEGAEMVGPLPAEYNNITTYAAGPFAGTVQADAANALIRFLHTPAAADVFKKRGLKPEGAAKAS
ncbi:MAG: substrate-binding domain-containing protein [Hyphomicrobiales bacterium]|nr:substrate-binding domain-containing protein [Hyphomicrobiales bacterium]